MDVALREVAEPAVRADELAERLVAARMLGWWADPMVARAAADNLVDALLPGSRVLDVVDDPGGGERVIGWVWLLDDAGDLEVLDTRLDVPERAPAVLDAVLAHAAAADLALVRATVVPGDAGREALVAAGAFTLAATTMLLVLGRTDRQPVAAGGVRIDPMTDREFEAFDAALRTAYVEERVASGDSPERAARTAVDQFAQLLADGGHSEHQHFFVARDGDRTVGHLWLHTGRPMVFVYDVEVLPALRSRGYGRAIMLLAARWAQERAAHALGLNVFAQNVVARGLYADLGFVVTEEHHQMHVPR